MDPFYRGPFDPYYYLCHKNGKTYEFTGYDTSYSADEGKDSNTLFCHNISWFIPSMFHQTILESKLARHITNNNIR